MERNALPQVKLLTFKTNHNIFYQKNPYIFAEKLNENIFLLLNNKTNVHFYIFFNIQIKNFENNASCPDKEFITKTKKEVRRDFLQHLLVTI